MGTPAPESPRPEVTLRDVTLRDGLQDEAPVPTDVKVAVFEALVAAGVRELELTSFVRPDRVPAMADAEALCRRTEAQRSTAGDEVVRWGLVLNRRGAERALDAGLRHLQYVVAVTDTFSRRNAGCPTADAIDGLAEVAQLAANGGTVEVTVAVAFGCPLEGRVDPAHTLEVAARCVDAGATAVGLADTIGVAVPGEVTALASRAATDLGVPVGLHLHDTRGLGVANALAGLAAGVRRFDAAAGALGGCPFAPGASGNVAIEDLAHVLEESGNSTGLSVPGLVDAAALVCEAVGRPVASHVGIAGPRFA